MQSSGLQPYERLHDNDGDNQWNASISGEEEAEENKTTESGSIQLPQIIVVNEAHLNQSSTSKLRVSAFRRSIDPTDDVQRQRH